MMNNLIENYKILHATQIYGNTSSNNFHQILLAAREIRAKNIIDYGCGQSTLYKMLNDEKGLHVTRFDPAIPEIAELDLTKKYDMVINTDVLEHIEEQDLDKILREIRRLSPNVFFQIHTGPAKTVLADGRNAHVTIRPVEWWKQKLSTYFTNVYIANVEGYNLYLTTFPIRKISLTRIFITLRKIISKISMKAHTHAHD